MAHVLIVDDEESERLLVRTILEEAGYELSFANSGEEAMKLYLRHSIDVVVTDIRMPHGDGIELIAALKGLDDNVSIVAISGEERRRLDAAQGRGARVTLSKPITREGLLAAVAKAVDTQGQG